MSRLVLIRGVPGAGKSTLAHQLSAARMNIGEWGFRFEADTFFTDRDGEYRFDASYLKDAHEWCRLQTLKAMKNHPDDEVFVSNTFVKMWEMEPYLKMAKKFNRDITIFELKTRYNSVHGVPLEKIEEMTKNFYPLEPELFPYYFGGMNSSITKTETYNCFIFTNPQKGPQ